jgi:hypothetical protein
LPFEATVREQLVSQLGRAHETRGENEELCTPPGTGGGIAVGPRRHVPVGFSFALYGLCCCTVEGGTAMAATFVKYLGNISILETSVAYRREVERYLDLMRTTRSGRILCSHINRKRGWMAIMPFNPTKIDPVNAFAYADPRSEADASPKNYLLLSDLKLPNGVTVKLPYGVGTGAGSPVYVSYHPATWRQLIKNSGRIPTGAGPAAILIHEMTHGLRMMCGLLRTDDPVTGNVDMDDIEEFNAILTANVYLSERGMTSMRASHHGFSSLDKTMSDSEVYYDTYKNEIDGWFNEQMAYCMEMAAIPTKFNPFREAAIARGLMQRPMTPMAL